MQLKDALNLMKFDVRLVDLYLKNGQITKAEYEKYLAGLADDAAMAEKVEIGDDYDDDDDFEE